MDRSRRNKKSRSRIRWRRLRHTPGLGVGGTSITL